MVTDIISETLHKEESHLSISEEVLSSMIDLREFLWSRVYENETVHADFHKTGKILRELYQFLIVHPDHFLQLIGKTSFYDTFERCVCDFLAGMTDRYAFSLYEKYFLPLPWVVK
jgi:dGTPase